jgi:hypothetical protein
LGVWNEAPAEATAEALQAQAELAAAEAEAVGGKEYHAWR